MEASTQKALDCLSPVRLQTHGRLLPPLWVLANVILWHRGYGATAAHLPPDQTVGSSNLSALIFSKRVGEQC